MLNASAGQALEANPKPMLFEAARAGGRPSPLVLASRSRFAKAFGFHAAEALARNPSALPCSSQSRSRTIPDRSLSEFLAKTPLIPAHPRLREDRPGNPRFRGTNGDSIRAEMLLSRQSIS